MGGLAFFVLSFPSSHSPPPSCTQKPSVKRGKPPPTPPAERSIPAAKCPATHPQNPPPTTAAAPPPPGHHHRGPVNTSAQRVTRLMQALKEPLRPQVAKHWSVCEEVQQRKEGKSLKERMTTPLQVIILQATTAHAMAKKNNNKIRVIFEFFFHVIPFCLFIFFSHLLSSPPLGSVGLMK